MGQTSAKNRSFIYGIFYAVGLLGALFVPLIGSMTSSLGYQKTFMIAGAISMPVTIVGGLILWIYQILSSKTAKA